MNIRALAISPLLVLVFVTAGSTIAHAEMYSYNGINYSVPVGFQSYSGGVYYNPMTGIYLNPVTGQTSTSPLPAVTISSYAVPQGYSVYNGSYGVYYNQNTNSYWSPTTGYYSSGYYTPPALPNPPSYVFPAVGYVQPTQVVSAYQVPQGYTIAQIVTNPALPTSGAGGDAAVTIVTLLASAAVMLGGVRHMLKRRHA